MGGPWRAQLIQGDVRVIPAPVARPRAQHARIASEAMTAAVVGIVVALVTSLGASLACFAYLRW